MDTNCELYQKHLDAIEQLNSMRHSNESPRRRLSGKVWFIADTHFYHKNIMKYCSRPFNCVEEMNETIIKNWNNTITQEDKVFLVGDFALCSSSKIIEVGKRLNGRKTLIMGNHDGASKQTYYNAGFEYISRHPIIFQDFFIVSHEPQYIQENGVYVNIFGHVHDNPIFKDYSNRSFCVSAERINYTPIEFQTILRTISNV